MSGFLAGGITHGTYLDKYSVLMHKKKVSCMHRAISRQYLAVVLTLWKLFFLKCI